MKTKRTRKTQIPKAMQAMHAMNSLYTIIEPTDKSKRVLDFTLMRRFLNNYHMKECNQYICMREPAIAFVWLNYDENSLHGLKRKYYRTSIYLQNSLDNMQSIDNKDKLHLSLKKNFL